MKTLKKFVWSISHLMIDGVGQLILDKTIYRLARSSHLSVCIFGFRKCEKSLAIIDCQYALTDSVESRAQIMARIQLTARNVIRNTLPTTRRKSGTTISPVHGTKSISNAMNLYGSIGAYEGSANSFRNVRRLG